MHALARLRPGERVLDSPTGYVRSEPLAPGAVDVGDKQGKQPTGDRRSASVMPGWVVGWYSGRGQEVARDECSGDCGP